MSEAKFAAAKELIQEKNYDAARNILKTINDPKATRWLAKLDEISPEIDDFPQVRPQTQPTISGEAESYYKAQNKERRRDKLADGIELIVGSFLVIGFGAIQSAPTIGGVPQQSNGWGTLFILVGIGMMILGIMIIRRRNKD